MRAVAQGFSGSGIAHSSESNLCATSWNVLDNSTGLAVLADSVSVYAGAAMASKLAVDAIVEVVQEKYAQRLGAANFQYHHRFQFQILAPILRSAVREANLVIQRAKTDYPDHREMATAMSAVLISNGFAIVVHVGDSRCYRFSRYTRPQLMRLTRDDTLQQEMRDAGSEEGQDTRILQSVRSNLTPKIRVLTKALGVHRSVAVSTQVFPVVQNDFLMLLSAGYYKTVEQKLIRTCLNNDLGLHKKTGLLMECFLRKKATDRCGLVLMQV